MNDPDDTCQIEIPESFLELYLEPGRRRLNASRHRIAVRYELCEDLAQTLHDDARARHLVERLERGDVLGRCYQGLTTAGAGIDSMEALWIVRRLAELLDWPAPEIDGHREQPDP